MLNRSIHALCLVLLGVASLMLAACTGGGGSGGSAAPVIALQPADATVMSGETASFSVVASASPAPSYQWRRNGLDIAGATSASYVTPALALADGGAVYTVAVSNSVGAVNSNDARLGVRAVTSAEKRSLLSVVLLTLELYLAGLSPYALIDNWVFVEPTTVCLSGVGSAMVNGVPAIAGQEVPTAATVSASFSNCTTAGGTSYSGSSSVAYDFPLFDYLAGTASATATSNNLRYTSRTNGTVDMDFTANGAGGFVLTGETTSTEEVVTITLTPAAGASVRNELSGLTETFAGGGLIITIGLDASENMRWRFAFDRLSTSISGVTYVAEGFNEVMIGAQGVTAGSGEVNLTADGVNIGRVYANASGLHVEVDGVSQPLKAPGGTARR